MRRVLAGAVGVALLAGMLVGAAGPAGAGQGEVRAWIVDLHDQHRPSQEAPRLARQYGGSVRHVYEHVLGGFAFEGSEQAAANLARNSKVRSVIADQSVHALAETLPTGVQRIDGPGAHVAGHTGSDVIVAILDTGIDLDHPDLNVNTSLGKNCIDGSKPPDDGHGHGTHVAGTVAAIANTVGVIGVASSAQVVPVKVLDDSGSGSWASIICGVDHVTGNATSIKVANMSLGGSGTANDCSEGLHKAICDSVTAGVTYTVAAGNDSQDASGFVPAAYPQVITVSAFSDLDGEPTDSGCVGIGRWKDCDEDFARFSNYGSIVDVIAPGVRIYSADKGGTYSTKSGTSMAAPHVAGVAALVIAANSGIAPADVEAHLKATGECPDKAFNDGDATCAGQGQWDGDPDGIPEPMVNAHRAATTTPGSGGGGGGDTGDTTAPTVAITDPGGGTTVSGIVTIQVDASDDVDTAAGTLKVEVNIDGGTWQVATWNASTLRYESSWDTTKVGDGTHAIDARATDAAGNVGNASQISVIVRNSTGDGSTMTATFSATSVDQGSTWRARVTITVTDDQGNPVEGATMTGTWSAYSGTTSCSTGSNGSCSVETLNIPKRVSNVSWTVGDVTKDGYTYTGDTPTITISKP